jgi:hypothetical protein
MTAPAPEPQPAPWWGVVVRPLILIAAAPVPIVNWLRRPDPLAPVSKRAQKVAYRARKSISRTVKLLGKRWQKVVVKPLRARMTERP